MTGSIASFHLVRERRGRAVNALAHLATDRRPLHRQPGLRFFRLLGTSRGNTTKVSMDLLRTAVFAIWDDDLALDEFLSRSPIAARWRHAEECYSVRLRARGGHGSWRGVEVLTDMARARERPDAPVAVLTRADVRPVHWPRFMRAGRRVSASLPGTEGLLAVVGIGEAPLGKQATFSMWASPGSVEAFVRSGPHADVARRTRAEAWYGEELFARFEPYAASGTWDGRDPLATGRPGPAG